MFSDSNKAHTHIYAYGPGAVSEGGAPGARPLLFLEKKVHVHLIFAKTWRLTVYGHPGTALLLKNFGAPSIENSRICPCGSYSMSQKQWVQKNGMSSYKFWFEQGYYIQFKCHNFWLPPAKNVGSFDDKVL